MENYLNESGIEDNEKDEKHVKTTSIILVLTPVIFFIAFCGLNFEQYKILIDTELGHLLSASIIITYMIGAILASLIIKSRATVKMKSLYLLVPALFLLVSTVIMIVAPTFVQLVQLMGE